MVFVVFHDLINLSINNFLLNISTWGCAVECCEYIDPTAESVPPIALLLDTILQTIHPRVHCMGLGHSEREPGGFPTNSPVAFALERYGISFCK